LVRNNKNILTSSIKLLKLYNIIIFLKIWYSFFKTCIYSFILYINLYIIKIIIFLK
jgi:hypothetical protein